MARRVLRIAAGLFVLVSIGASHLVRADEWPESDGTFGEMDRMNLEEAAPVELDENGTESDEQDGRVVARAGCQGYTCSMRSSCGLAPLNRIGRSRSSVTPYITNGEDQIHGEWPSYARLETRWKDGSGALCGGVIVSDMHILTAAHCVHSDKKSAISWIHARLGVHSFSTRTRHEKVYYSRSQCVPKGYISGNDSARWNHDWAVLTLATRIQFTDYIQPACLPYGFSGRPQYKHCHLVGLGTTGFKPDGTRIHPRIVQKQRVRQVSCAKVGRIDRFVTLGQACYAKAISLGSSCYGDSGGPILCIDTLSGRWTVIGTSSASHNNCDGKEYSSIHARTTTLLPYIKAECGI